MIERTSDRWVSIVLSILLHGTLVAVLVYGFWTYRQSRPPAPTLAIEATVVDSKAVNAPAVNPPQPAPPAAQPKPSEPQPPPEPVQPEPAEPTGPPQPTPEELAQRAHQEQAEKDRLAREQAEHEAAQKQRQLDQQKQQEEAQRQADEKRRQREAQDKAEAERKAAEARKRAEEQRVAEQKRAEAAKRAEQQKAQEENEAELRSSLAAEERANQLASSGAVSSWEAQISARIHRAWIQPPSARAGVECSLIVTQARGGAVLNAKIGACNGDQAVRESIVAAAYRASPLPPPPDPSLFQPDVEVMFRPQ